MRNNYLILINFEVKIHRQGHFLLMKIYICVCVYVH